MAESYEQFQQLLSAVRDLVALSEAQMRLIRHQNEVIVKLVRAAGDNYDPDGERRGKEIRELNDLFKEAFEVYRQGADYGSQGPIDYRTADTEGKDDAGA